MKRPQFTLRALLVAVLVVAAFFAGIHFERERQRRADLEMERLASEAERARVMREAMAIQARLSQSSARLQKALQEIQERRQIENAQLLRRIAEDHKRWLDSKDTSATND